MFKNLIISILTAELVAANCFQLRDQSDKTALVIGITAAVFIFCIFLEELYEKCTNYVKRVRKIRKTVEELRKGDLWKESH